MTRITFIVPVRNDARRLARCLESLRRQEGAGPFDVIVADNGSNDASPDVAAAAGARVLSLPDLSVAALRNRAAAAADGDVLAFVDADHLLAPRWVDAARSLFGDASIAAAGAPYEAAADANWVQRAYDRFRPHYTGTRDVEWLGSGNLAVRRAVFERVGGFDTRLETCEDVDLCNRIRADGHRLVADDRLKSAHLGDPATLRQLFFGELWRGRDNIRVSLRGPLTLRALPSLLIPVAGLVCAAAVVGGIAAGSRGVPFAAAGAGVFAALAGLRAARMTANAARPSAADVAANLVVAAVYDAARALALVTRATHKTRREVAGEQVNA